MLRRNSHFFVGLIGLIFGRISQLAVEVFYGFVITNCSLANWVFTLLTKSNSKVLEVWKVGFTGTKSTNFNASVLVN